MFIVPEEGVLHSDCSVSYTAAEGPQTRTPAPLGLSLLLGRNHQLHLSAHLVEELARHRVWDAGRVR